MTGEVALGSIGDNMFVVADEDAASIDWLELTENMLVSLFKIVVLAPLRDVVNCRGVLDTTEVNMSFSLLEIANEIVSMVNVGVISEGVMKIFSELLVTEGVIKPTTEDVICTGVDTIEDISIEGLVDDGNTGVLATPEYVDGSATSVEVGSSVDRISEMLVVCEILVTIFVVGKKSNEKSNGKLFIDIMYTYSLQHLNGVSK